MDEETKESYKVVFDMFDQDKSGEGNALIRIFFDYFLIDFFSLRLFSFLC